MQGIIFPKDWKRILKEKVIEDPLRQVTTEELMAKLLQQLKKCLEAFNGQEFCLALSGGLDSTVLAFLLKNFLNTSFSVITIGRTTEHPDIIFATDVAKILKLSHKVFTLSDLHESKDTYTDLFAAIRQTKYRHSIHADTIDEMQGGYWLHKKNADRKTFNDYWERLIPEHLNPLMFYSKKCNISVGLPYLAAHDLLRRIEIKQRVDNKQGKILLRQLAIKVGVPEKIINRKKIGLCSVWDKF